MKKSFWLTLAVLQGALILLLAGLLMRAGPLPRLAAESDEHRPAAPGAASGTSGGVVHLDEVVQRASALRVARTEGWSADAVSVTFGQVLPALALTEARQRLQQARADREQAELGVRRADLEATRLQRLWEEGGNVAHRLVDQSALDLDQAKLRLHAAQAQGEGVATAIRADWGDALLHALDAPDGGALAEVLAGRQSLVLLTEGGQTRASLCIAEHPEICTTARRLAPAPQAESASAAPSWFWLAPSASLRSGMRVALHTHPGIHDQHATGLRVPESAVVWHAGQAWVFVPRDATHFERRAVSLGVAVPGGWFVAARPEALPMVVVQGAQLLLSEESKGQIRNENGD